MERSGNVVSGEGPEPTNRTQANRAPTLFRGVMKRKTKLASKHTVEELGESRCNSLNRGIEALEAILRVEGVEFRSPMRALEFV